MNNLNYEAALVTLFTQLPMFQRDGPAAYKADLSATKKVCVAIGNPERRLRFVHVAGTNGKGTVCHMVSAVLQCAGHRVGLFTSPHLIDFRERIRVNGECISESAVVDFVNRWQAQNVAWGTPSFFELTFAMAMDEFERQGCDIVVLETGMGGRLDSTNVIPAPEVAVVTNIGMDHQAFLGSDIRSIAREKGGIFKDGVPVVLGPMRPDAQSELLAAALKTSSEVHFAQDFKLKYEHLVDAEDSFVIRANVGTAYATLHVLKQMGWHWSEQALTRGLNNHAILTGQLGRWQRIDLLDRPLVVLDGAHNLDGVTRTVEELETLTKKRGGHLHVVWGAVSDKDASAVMGLLPEDAMYWWCAADIPRAMSPDLVANVRPELSGGIAASPVDALQLRVGALFGRRCDLGWRQLVCGGGCASRCPRPHSRMARACLTLESVVGYKKAPASQGPCVFLSGR